MTPSWKPRPSTNLHRAPLRSPRPTTPVCPALDSRLQPFYPPTLQAATLALGALEFLEHIPDTGTAKVTTHAHANIKAFLRMTCECHPDAPPMDKPHVS